MADECLHPFVGLRLPLGNLEKDGCRVCNARSHTPGIFLKVRDLERSKMKSIQSFKLTCLQNQLVHMERGGNRILLCGNNLADNTVRF